MLLQLTFVIFVHESNKAWMVSRDLLGSNKNLPIILIHGFGGTQLEVKLNNTKSLYFYCSKNYGWFFAWFRIYYNIIKQQCFYETFSMIYDSISNQMINKFGVSFRTFGAFGETKGIRYIYPYLSWIGSYYEYLMSMLETKLKYTNMVDLFSAQYDFRNIGGTLENISDQRKINEYFDKLSNLIEQVSFRSNLPVILVSHSLGGVLTSHFLKKMSLNWKTKYLDSWYSISGTFGGTTSSLQAIINSYTLKLPQILLNINDFREMSATFSTLYMLFPSKLIYDPNYEIVSLPDRKYKIKSIKEDVLKAVNPDMMKMVNNIPEPFVHTPPRIPTVCVYGTNIKTISRLISKDRLISQNYDFEYSIGDGVAEHISLSSCKRWIIDNSTDIEIFELNKGDHATILYEKQLLDHLYNFVRSRRNKISPPTGINQNLP